MEIWSLHLQAVKTAVVGPARARDDIMRAAQMEVEWLWSDICI